MPEYECIHTWGPGAGCDNKPIGLLCYAPRGEAIPRVDLSCERFANYHGHHGGIAVLLAWELKGTNYEQVKAELKENRDLFKEQIGRKFDGNTLPNFVSQRETIEEGVMKAYDALVRIADSKSKLSSMEQVQERKLEGLDP